MPDKKRLEKKEHGGQLQITYENTCTACTVQAVRPAGLYKLCRRPVLYIQARQTARTYKLGERLSARCPLKHVPNVTIRDLCWNI